MPNLRLDKSGLKDACPPIHINSYLSEINKNNEFAAKVKKIAFTISRMVSIRNWRGFCGNFFLRWKSLPSAHSRLKGRKNENVPPQSTGFRRLFSG
jgi:hypothetical protein